MEFFSINFVNILQHAINHQHGLTAIKAFAAMLACTALTACTTAGQVLFSLLPDGTVPVLLSNFERESDTNRRRVAELERAGDWAGLAKFADENLEKDKILQRMPHNLKTLEHLLELDQADFAAFRSVLDGERGEGPFTRIERWALKRLSGVLPIESLWHFNAKYHPTWLPRFLVYPAAESFVPVVAAILRAESLTEIPVIGRFLVNDPSQRPGTVVPPEVLEAAGQS